MIVDVFLLRRVVLHHPGIVTEEQLFEAAHCDPFGDSFLLGIGDTQMPKPHPVPDHDVIDFAVQGDQETPIESV